MRGHRPSLVLIGAVLLVFLFAGWTETSRPVKGPHGRLELALLNGARDLPWVVGEFFATSGRCAGCHGHDPAGLASMDAQGNDINIVDDWRSTMMANSARDPFFRAKLEHEVLMAPGHATEIENDCLSCHAPMGMHEEKLADHPPFTAAMLDTSSLGLDGVGCLACHMQSPEEAGSFFSGDLRFTPHHVYGPYASDQIDPSIMTSFVGWVPEFGEHMVDSRNCAGCHTLITQTMDLEGGLTGDEFVEQATYHEWKNSIYSSTDVHCNSCHMPRTDDPILLAAEYAFLTPQSPFGKHHFVGGNVHMLRILKTYKELLGIQATDVQFDSTIARTENMLRQRTLDIGVQLTSRDPDSARFEIRLENRAGHRFPSGYPSRRAFIEFIVLDVIGDTVFKSGRLRSDLEIEGKDPFEPHYDLIRSQDEVQVYELVMGDVNGDETTVLHRAKQPLKDNRLVPLGFTTTHMSYDTTRIVGVPETDLDFNKDLFGEEGSGSDIVRYHVALNGNTNGLRAFARVWFQPVPPGWNAEMFSHNGTHIDAFRDMLAASDGTPILVAVDSLLLGPVGMEERPEDRITVHPNPTDDGWVAILAGSGVTMEPVALHNSTGEAVPMLLERHAHGWRIRLPDPPGVYLMMIRMEGSLLVQRVVRR